ncbi:MAG: hypothetical protein WC135_06605 [Bacteroidales bacterium]
MIELKNDTQSANKKYFCIVKGNYLSHKFKTHSFDLEFTDNLTFNNLETRMHNDLLSQKSETREVIESEYRDIKALQDVGRSYDEISLELGISKSSVSRRVSKFNKLRALEKSK